MITIPKFNKVATVCVALLLVGSIGCKNVLDEKVFSQVAVDALSAKPAIRRSLP